MKDFVNSLQKEQCPDNVLSTYLIKAILVRLESRVSPLPHPHTSGNMWLARCDYIAKLIDPATDFASKSNLYPPEYKSGNNPCKGYGRFFSEHWVHSHPSVMPCDLFKQPTYFYGYRRAPDASFEIDLQIAPKRFPAGLFNGIYDGVCSRYKGRANAGLALAKERLWDYQLLNHEQPDKSWWGWEFYNLSFDDMNKILANKLGRYR